MFNINGKRGENKKEDNINLKTKKNWGGLWCSLGWRLKQAL